MDVSVREVEEGVFRDFRAKATSKGLKTGTALTQAMKEWSSKSEKAPKRSFFDLKPFHGKNSDLSENVDKYLYGGKD